MKSSQEKKEMMNHRFEFLYGVRRDIQKNFKKNHDVGIYMPYGKEWLSYTMRRLKEFKNIKFVAENLIKEKYKKKAVFCAFF